METIINKVAQSSLVVFDLEDFYPKEPIVSVDISTWLEDGFILKEKAFREALKQHDWQMYTNKIVVITNHNEAIIPSWTHIFVASHLEAVAKYVYFGTKEAMLIAYYQKQIDAQDFSAYNEKPVILKGCSKKPVPEQAYLFALTHLQKVSKSIMYGEACSAVPIFKRK